MDEIHGASGFAVFVESSHAEGSPQSAAELRSKVSPRPSEMACRVHFESDAYCLVMLSRSGRPFGGGPSFADRSPHLAWLPPSSNLRRPPSPCAAPARLFRGKRFVTIQA